MKKRLLLIIGVSSLVLLSACNLKGERQTESLTTKTKMSSTYDEDVQKAIEEGKQRIKQVEQEKQSEKAQKIASNEPLIEIKGQVTDILTKPDSGLDLYRITLKVENIKQDKNNLYEDNVGTDYQYFLSAHNYEKFDFNKLEVGDTLKIETFQEAHMTESLPQQIDEDGIAMISLIN